MTSFSWSSFLIKLLHLSGVWLGVDIRDDLPRGNDVLFTNGFPKPIDNWEYLFEIFNKLM